MREGRTLMSPASCHVLARGPRWALVALLVAALPFASTAIGATATVFTATTVSQLIGDIEEANANPARGPYTINLLAGTVYTLTVEAAPSGGTGLPAILSGVDLTVVGNGATIQRSPVAGTPAFRIFSVAGGATLRLRALVVRNGSVVGASGPSGSPGTSRPGEPGGNAVGGALLNRGALSIADSAFANNHTGGGAGGNGGSGPDHDGVPGSRGGDGGAGGSADGGAISNLGTLTVTGSLFSGNTAFGGAGGGGGNGGNGINSIAGAGGNGGKGGLGTGGAITNSGIASVTNSTFTAGNATGNAGGNGGNPGTGTFGGNQGGLGASGGTGTGGAIANTASGTITVTNSTLTANSAIGGAAGTGYGAPGATAMGSGGGLRTEGGGATLRNTIVAANPAISDGNCGNYITDGGYNLEFSPTTTCGFLDHATLRDPTLGALVNHGGPTPTMALGPGSAAINNASPTVCAGAAGSMDQRGLPRQAGQCSIGAFEPQPAPFPTLNALSSSSGTTSGGSRVTVTGTGFVSGATVAFGATYATTTVTGPTTLSVIVPAHAPGTVDLVVTNPDMQAATLSPGYTFGVVPILPGAKPTTQPVVSPGPLPGMPRPTARPKSATPNPLPRGR